MDFVTVLVIFRAVGFVPCVDDYYSYSVDFGVHGLMKFVIWHRLHRVLVSVHFILSDEPPSENIAKL